MVGEVVDPLGPSSLPPSLPPRPASLTTAALPSFLPTSLSHLIPHPSVHLLCTLAPVHLLLLTTHLQLGELLDELRGEEVTAC